MCLLGQHILSGLMPASQTAQSAHLVAENELLLYYLPCKAPLCSIDSASRACAQPTLTGSPLLCSSLQTLLFLLLPLLVLTLYSLGPFCSSLLCSLCSGYFQCQDGMLLSLHMCPDGLEYSTPRQACVHPEESSCQEHPGGQAGGVPRRSALFLSKADGEGRSCLTLCAE